MWINSIHKLGVEKFRIVRMGFTPDPAAFQYWTGEKWGGFMEAKLYDDENVASLSIARHRRSNPTDQYFMRFYTSRKED